MKHIGYWVMPGGGDTVKWQIRFTAFKKPSWRQRLCMIWLLGWKWEDA